MAIKYGLKTVTDNSENVAFYDNHGPINATKEYNAFGDALSAVNDLAGTLVKIIFVYVYNYNTKRMHTHS
jgi:hypothetical protein